MTAANPYNALRVIMLGEASITSELLPQAALPNLATAPIFVGRYPRKREGVAQTAYEGHDWAALLHQQAIKMILITASGRAASGGDTTRAPWSRPRMDVQAFGRDEDEALGLLLIVEAFLKELSNARAALATGTVLIRDVTVEGGPIEFPDPETEAPEAVGIYAASAIEEFVA